MEHQHELGESSGHSQLSVFSRVIQKIFVNASCDDLIWSSSWEYCLLSWEKKKRKKRVKIHAKTHDELLTEFPRLFYIWECGLINFPFRCLIVRPDSTTNRPITWPLLGGTRVLKSVTQQWHCLGERRDENLNLNAISFKIPNINSLPSRRIFTFSMLLLLIISQSNFETVIYRRTQAFHFNWARLFTSD